MRIAPTGNLFSSKYIIQFIVILIYLLYVRVIEFVEKPPSECLSAIGQLLGLEPVVTYSSWCPKASSFLSRVGVEGFHILTKLPVHNMGSYPFETFSPDSFSTEFDTAIDDCLRKCQKVFGASDSVVANSWVNWSKTLSPRGFTAVDYVEKTLQLETWFPPMEDDFHVDFRVRVYDWKLNAERLTFEAATFEYPSVLAAAMASVKTRFNNHPEQSRLYASLDGSLVEHVNYFKEKTAMYYSSNGQLSLNSQDKLKNIIRHRVTVSGGSPGTIGNKAKNLKVIYDDDIMFLNSHYRRIIDIDMFLVYKQLVQPLSDKELNSDVSSISCQGTIYKLKMSCFRSLNEGNQIASELVDYAMIMFQAKDDLLHHTYAAVNSKLLFYSFYFLCLYFVNLFYVLTEHSQHYVPYLKSLYLPSDFLAKLAAPDSWRCPFEIPEAQHLHRIYIPFRDSDTTHSDNWSALVLAFDNKVVYYLSSRNDNDARKKAKLDNYLQLVNTWLQINSLPTFGSWKSFSQTGAQLSEVIERDCDTGIFIITALQFVAYGCPVVFTRADMTQFRVNIAYHFLKLFDGLTKDSFDV